MASAAGLNTFAERDRRIYLLNTPAIDVTVTTHHGSCARSTMATIIAVNTAPLGNSSASFLTRRMNISTRPAPSAAASIPGPTVRIPCPGAASAVSARRMMVSRPFGVLKKFFALRRNPQPPRLVPLQVRREQQPLHTHPLQQCDPRLWSQHECRGC